MSELNLTSRRCLVTGLLLAMFSEARAVDTTWIGPDGSFWELAANWSPARPGAADVALLGSFATALRSSSGTFALQSFTGTGTLTIGGGILRPSLDSSIASLVMTGGTLSGAGTVSAATLDWRGGTMGETGANAGGVTRVTGATTFGGSGQMVLQAGRRLELLGDAQWTQDTTDTGTQIRLFGSGANAAVLSIGNGVTLVDGGGSDPNATRLLGFSVNAGGRVDNAGTYRRTGLGTTEVRSAFDNAGVVDVQSGALALTGGGTGSGRFDIAAGAQLQFGINSTSYALTGATIDNAGELDTSGVGGTLSLDAATRLLGNGAVHIGSGTFDSASALQLASFSLSGSASQTIARLRADASIGGLTMTGGSLGGAGTITAGSLSWTGGTMGETGANAGGTTIVLGDAVIDSQRVDLQAGRRLELRGNTSWRQNAGGVNSILISGSGASAGVLAIGAGAEFVDAGNAGAADPIRAIGASGGGAIDNAGTLRREGLGITEIRSRIDNRGLVDVAGGTLNFVATTSLQGTGGLRIGAQATVDLSHGNSTVGTLDQQGGVDSLDLGTRALTVSSDYQNVAFGSGNAFDRRAHVLITGTGNRLLAAGNANQAITGSDVVNGTSVTPGLVIGNVHVGTNTRSYAIANSGSSGPALRGALQDAVNGGTITDARLTGSGARAGDWGPVAPGASAAREVVFTVDSAGVYTPLAGQTINILNNFDNTRSQRLAITSRAGAAAYDYAVASVAPASPVVLANQRVGGSLRAGLAIGNTAPAGAFSEALDARLGTVTGDALAEGGPIALLAAGASDGSTLRTGIDTASAGAKHGTVTLDFDSDGAGSSGLGITALPSRTLEVAGAVFRLAGAGAHQPEPIVFAARHVGDAAAQALSLTNTAAADGYSERLNARIAATAGDAGSSSGSFTLLAAGASDDQSLVIRLDTASAGHKSGTATLALASDGTGTSGFAAFDLATQLVHASGEVWRLAVGAIDNPAPIDLGSARVGDGTGTIGLHVRNAAPDDGLSEKLNATVGAVDPGFHASGAVNLLGPGASDSNALRLGLDTTVAGTKNGIARVDFTSDGSGTSQLGQSAAGSQNVALQGKVYAPAVATLTTHAIDFGIVHIGESVAAAPIGVRNEASGALTDSLRGNVASVPTGFLNNSGSSIADLPAGAQSTALAIALDTATAGAFSGDALLAFASHDADLGDLDLGVQRVALLGQVNDYAHPVLDKIGGDGSFTADGAHLTLDFGTLDFGHGVSALLSLANLTSGPADALGARFAAGAGPFTLTGFENFDGLTAGAGHALGVALDGLRSGLFEQLVTLSVFGSNASGFQGGLGTLQLTLRAEIRGTAPVPLPGTAWLLLSGTLGLVARRRAARTGHSAA